MRTIRIGGRQHCKQTGLLAIAPRYQRSRLTAIVLSGKGAGRHCMGDVNREDMRGVWYADLPLNEVGKCSRDNMYLSASSKGLTQLSLRFIAFLTGDGVDLTASLRVVVRA